jgi:hypothetical protein
MCLPVHVDGVTFVDNGRGSAATDVLVFYSTKMFSDYVDQEKVGARRGKCDGDWILRSERPWNEKDAFEATTFGAAMKTSTLRRLTITTVLPGIKGLAGRLPSTVVTEDKLSVHVHVTMDNLSALFDAHDVVFLQSLVPRRGL